MILNLDCVAGMRALIAENSVDAIVTDPPYELGFMGKGWDSTGIANSVPMWAEALRVLKPGGHLLAFSGTRTYHRMVCAIEDAGFEIRDQLQWIYGSGFPKSLDVSKAIDKSDAAKVRLARRFRFTKWMRSTGLTPKRVDELTGTTMGHHLTTHPTQPAVATRAQFEALRPHIAVEVPAWVEQLVDERTVESENFKAREVVGQRMTGIGTGGGATAFIGDGSRNVTVAHSTEAQQWEGWGTALKPAHEPIVLSRKPLAGTVAANVLAWGVGALNIDASRVGGDRWPANILHDGSDEVIAAFPDAGGQQGDLSGQSEGRVSRGVYGDMPRAREHAARIELDKSAARFFYCAKASKADRDEGLEGFVPATTSDGPAVAADNAYQRGKTERANIHPTVKPTALMRYLCRLVTPPGGLVLDPFAGSGSTGKAAHLEGFQFIGFEQSAEYAAIAAARIGPAP